jgi:two-component system, NarL family, response regulator
MPFTVLIADDHPVVREGLACIINHQSDMRVVAEAADGREAVAQFFAHSPDVALLDLGMPIMDGVEALIAIFEKSPLARVVILTAHHGEEDIYRALRAGAQGYVLKETPTEELIATLRAVASGRTLIPPAVGAKLAKRVGARNLTRREMDVLRSIAAGKSNKEIAVALNISGTTVKVHVTHLLEKLKASCRTEAISMALKRGLVHLDDTAVA